MDDSLQDQYYRMELDKEQRRQTLETLALIAAVGVVGHLNVARLRAQGVQTTWMDRHEITRTFLLMPFRYFGLPIMIGVWLMWNVVRKPLWHPGIPVFPGHPIATPGHWGTQPGDLNGAIWWILFVTIWLGNWSLNHYFRRKLYPQRVLWDAYMKDVNRAQRRQHKQQVWEAEHRPTWRPPEGWRPPANLNKVAARVGPPNTTVQRGSWIDQHRAHNA